MLKLTHLAGFAAGGGPGVVPDPIDFADIFDAGVTATAGTNVVTVTGITVAITLRLTLSVAMSPLKVVEVYRDGSLFALGSSGTTVDVTIANNQTLQFDLHQRRRQHDVARHGDVDEPLRCRPNARYLRLFGCPPAKRRRPWRRSCRDAKLWTKIKTVEAAATKAILAATPVLSAKTADTGQLVAALIAIESVKQALAEAQTKLKGDAP